MRHRNRLLFSFQIPTEQTNRSLFVYQKQINKYGKGSIDVAFRLYLENVQFGDYDDDDGHDDGSSKQ